jgi:hypothetical protein
VNVEDIPAAHSMDTEWFAVDADGHVGLFETGEDGAYPEEGWPDAPKETEAASRDAVIEYAFLRGWVAEPEDPMVEARRLGAAAMDQHAWFRAALADEQAAREHYVIRRAQWEAASWLRRFLRRWERWRRYEPHPPSQYACGGTMVMTSGVPAPNGVVQVIGELQVVTIQAIQLADLRRLHEQGLCRGCAALPAVDEFAAGLADAGIFAFRPEIDYAGAVLSPYRRCTPAPARPRRLGEFEPEFVRRLQAVRLTDAQFERDELVQPARTLICTGYVEPAPAYLDVDLRTVRAQRGMAAEYAVLRAQAQAGEGPDHGEVWEP